MNSAPNLNRPPWLESLAPLPALTSIVAPLGWGKTTLAREVLRPYLGALALSATEGAGSYLLWTEALLKALRGAYPDAIAAHRLLRLGRRRPLGELLESLREALGLPELVLILDDIGSLQAGELKRRLMALVADPPERLRLILLSDAPLGSTWSQVGPIAPLLSEEALFLSAEEIARRLETPEEGRAALAQAIYAESGGWPALVGAALNLGAMVTSAEARLDAYHPWVEGTLSVLSPEAQHVLQIIGVVSDARGYFERQLLEDVVRGDGSGSPAVRVRLMSLGPEVLVQAQREIWERKLVRPEGEGFRLKIGLRAGLWRYFSSREPEAFQEAQRRVAQYSMTVQGEALQPDIAERFYVAGSRRLDEVLAAHGSRFELEMEQAEKGKLLDWLGALGPESPTWAELLKASIFANQCDEERAREAMERVREDGAFLTGPGAWLWRVRVAEVEGILSWIKWDLRGARSWFSRALDQLEDIAQRLERPDVAFIALRRRVAYAFAMVCWESLSWERGRAALEKALAYHEGGRAEPIEALRGALICGALAAGDLETLGRQADGAKPASEDPSSQAAALALKLLTAPSVGPICDALRALPGPLGTLLASRIVADCEPCVQLRHISNVPPNSWFEREIRLRREPASPPRAEGLMAALVHEKRAHQDGKHWFQVMESYRHLGAYWSSAVAAYLWFNHWVTEAPIDKWPTAELAEVIAECAKHAERLGYQLPGYLLSRADKDQPALKALLLLFVQHGSEWMRAWVQKTAEARGLTLAAEEVKAREAITRQRATKPSGMRAPYVLTTRQEIQPLSATQYHALMEEPDPKAFILSVPDQVAYDFGKEIPLGRKRIITPLLMVFLKSPEEAFTMRELALQVWEISDVTSAVRTKVKVAISRLRSLLGKNRHYVITTEKEEDGTMVVAYQAAPKLSYGLIELGD